MKIFCYLLSFALLTSCGYHTGKNEHSKALTVSVPYVKEDFSGLFTNEIIKQVSFCPLLNYQSSKADYTLNIEIIKKDTKQIGYKYDRNNQNVRLKPLRATEGRQIITAKVTLIENKTNKIALGPFNVSSDSEFDYVDPDSINDLSFINPEGSRDAVLVFSLGQLDSIDSAKDQA